MIVTRSSGVRFSVLILNKNDLIDPTKPPEFMNYMDRWKLIGVSDIAIYIDRNTGATTILKNRYGITGNVVDKRFSKLYDETRLED